MMRAFFATVSLAAMAATASPAFSQEMKAEVIHWWTSGGESAAVKVFAEQFAKAGGTWVDSAVAGGVNARTAAINRTVGGNPPTAMQFNTGKQFDDLVENNLLADIDAVATEGRWKSLMPDPIVAAATRNGRMFAVPVNIHGQNWLWYNKEVLDSVGAAEPRGWDDAIAIMDKVKARGVIPLAFSGQKNWERGLFNAVLLDKGGPALWNGLYARRDQAMVRGADFRAAVETYAKLRAYVDPGAPGRNWNDATALVIQGKAAMQLMGDWAKGEFAAANKVAGKDYGCAIIGSRGGGYVMGGDVFAFPKPKDAATAKAQVALARVMLDPETQLRFAQKKGSIPVRSDVDVSTLDICAQKAMKLISDKSQQVGSVEILAPPAMLGALEDVYSQFWNTPSQTTDQLIEKVVAVLRQQL